MNAQKTYRLLVSAFIIGLASSFLLLYYASQWLNASGNELSSLRNEVASLDKQRNDLDNARRLLKDYEFERSLLPQVLPKDKDQARVIREINQIADLVDLNIASISFPSSTLGTQTLRAPTQAESSTPTSNGSATSADQAPAPKSVSQATPVKDIPGVQSVEITLGAINSKKLPKDTGMRYDEMIDFIRLLERNQRTIQIRSLGIIQKSPINGEPVFGLDIALSIFLKP